MDHRLLDLGAHLAYPATPELTSTVRARLALPAPRRVLTRRRGALVALAAIAAVVFGVPPVRTAIAHWLGIRGVEIIPGHGTPHATVGAHPDLGTPTTLGGAARTVRFRIAVPAELGAPDAVYTRHDLGPMVSLVYRPRAGVPESRETGVGVLITEFIGSTDEPLVQKFVEPGTTVTSVEVGGEPGFWIGGTPHQIAYQVPGAIGADELRLAGPTLVFEHGAVTVRIEGSIAEAQALAIAASLHP